MSAQHVTRAFHEGIIEPDSHSFTYLMRWYSDVLFRHCKGHSQVALNRRKDHDDQGHGQMQALDGTNQPSQYHLAGHMAGPTPAPSLQGGDMPMPDNVPAIHA